jgi:RNA polymerase sigma-70 factor (ECF subfamily)
VLDALGTELDGYHLFHAVRADLLARSGNVADADATYARALALATNRAEHALLERKRAALTLDP